MYGRVPTNKKRKRNCLSFCQAYNKQYTQPKERRTMNDDDKRQAAINLQCKFHGIPFPVDVVVFDVVGPFVSAGPLQ